MKRLMIIAFMFISFLVQADDANAPSTNANDNQSSSDVTKQSDDDASISIANVHHINLDTTQVDGGGNWLNKRAWYERAQNVFDEVRVQINSMTDLRIQFSNEVNAVGHKIDSFFEVVDFTKAELDAKFKEILVALDTEQKIVGDLSAQERTLQTTIKQEIKVIEQVGKNIKSIGEVDNKIDETLMQAFKTIDECNDYESKAWDAFKSIGKELDDKKARNLYYQMNNYKQNVDQKITYLKTSLLPYLHNVLVAKIDANIVKINQSIDDLKTKGIDLQKIMSKTQEDDIIALHEREKAATQIAVRKAIEEEEKKAKELAEQFEQKLKESEKNSFSNVMHQYYGSTIGRVVAFVHQGYAGISIDYIGSFFTGFFRSYSYPVITYCYHAIIAGKDSIYNFISKFIITSGGKSKIKDAVVEKIEKKVEEAQQTGQTVKELIQEKIAEKIEASTAVPTSSSDASVASQAPVTSSAPETPPAKTADVITPEVTTAPAAVTTSDAPSTNATATDTTPLVVPSQTTQPAVDVTSVTTTQSPLISTPATTPTDSVTPSVENKPADQVVVQSIAQDVSDDREPIKTSGLYQLFKAVLDFIGTMFVSIYRCISQFFVMMWKFASYVSFSN